MFDPAVVTPVVDMLEGLAGPGPRAGARDRYRPDRASARRAWRARRRNRRLGGDGRSASGEAAGEDIEVAIGDFSTTRIGGEFALVYLVFNTIFNLVTQDAQVACFENAAAHLDSGGRFVIETHVPDLQRLPPGQTIIPFRADPEGSRSTSTTS